MRLSDFSTILTLDPNHGVCAHQLSNTHYHKLVICCIVATTCVEHVHNLDDNCVLLDLRVHVIVVHVLVITHTVCKCV
jgi:hypothetical protein